MVVLNKPLSLRIRLLATCESSLTGFPSTWKIWKSWKMKNNFGARKSPGRKRKNVLEKSWKCFKNTLRKQFYHQLLSWKISILTLKSPGKILENVHGKIVGTLLEYVLKSVFKFSQFYSFVSGKANHLKLLHLTLNNGAAHCVFSVRYVC